MPDTKLCRICVRKDVKMYEHDRFQLKFYYKEVTGSKVRIVFILAFRYIFLMILVVLLLHYNRRDRSFLQEQHNHELKKKIFSLVGVLLKSKFKIHVSE